MTKIFEEFRKRMAEIFIDYKYDVDNKNLKIKELIEMLIEETAIQLEGQLNQKYGLLPCDKGKIYSDAKAQLYMITFEDFFLKN